MPVRFEARGPLALLTLDRPEALNAIDPEMDRELSEGWRRFRDDPNLRVAILTGAGDRAFSAGVDLKKMGEFYRNRRSGTRGDGVPEEPELGWITGNVDVGKPTIAAVNGLCLGGALEIALACDVRIASDRATFGFPEVRWAILPGQGGTQRLPRVVGPGAALELILSGGTIDARRALELGLVSRVVAPTDLLPEAVRLGEQIAQNHPEAVRRAREAVRRGIELPLAAGLRIEQELAEPLRDSEDSREARKAFAEKRPPRWSTK